MTRAHEPMFIYRRWPDTDVHTFYSLGDGSGDLDESEKRLRAAMDHYGARVKAIHERRARRYDSHR